MNTLTAPMFRTVSIDLINSRVNAGCINTTVYVFGCMRSVGERDRVVLNLNALKLNYKHRKSRRKKRLSLYCTLIFSLFFPFKFKSR